MTYKCMVFRLLNTVFKSVLSHAKHCNAHKHRPIGSFWWDAVYNFTALMIHSDSTFGKVSEHVDFAVDQLPASTRGFEAEC